MKRVEDRGYLNTFATEPEPDPPDEEVIWTTQLLFDLTLQRLLRLAQSAEAVQDKSST